MTNENDDCPTFLPNEEMTERVQVILMIQFY